MLSSARFDLSPCDRFNADFVKNSKSAVKPAVAIGISIPNRHQPQSIGRPNVLHKTLSTSPILCQNQLSERLRARHPLRKPTVRRKRVISPRFTEICSFARDLSHLASSKIPSVEADQTRASCVACFQISGAGVETDGNRRWRDKSTANLYWP